MALTEQEIADLSGYFGATQIPADFDEFWAERMAEADGVELEYCFCPADVPDHPSCTFSLLRFRGMHGATLYAKYIRPRTKEKLPMVLQFHGYPGASRSWLEQASFAGMGCALLAMDCPGQGGLGDDIGGYKGTTVTGHIVAGLDGEAKDMYYVRLYQNIRILCRIVREMDGINLDRVFVNGASQGGALATACAALNPELINRAGILYPFLSDFRMVWELRADLIAYEGLRYYARWFDPDGSRQDEWFAKLGYIDTKNFAHLVRCPVMFGTGLDDNICPPQTQCAVYNNLSVLKRRYLFPGYGHEEIQEFDDLLIGFFGREEATP